MSTWDEQMKENRVCQVRNPRCCEQVHDTGRLAVGFHQCERYGVVHVDGKWYCKQHDPAVVRARQSEAEARYQAYVAKSKRESLVWKLTADITLEMLEAGRVTILLDGSPFRAGHGSSEYPQAMQAPETSASPQKEKENDHA